MFSLTKLSNDLFLIVKKEAIEKEFDFPNETPFETYGFITMEQGFAQVITKSDDVLREQEKLIELILEDDD